MPGGEKTITDHVREKSAADRAMLMRWVMSAEAAKDASVKWAFISRDDRSPMAHQYYGVQYAYVDFPETKPSSCPLESDEWARLRAEHPYGVKVRVVSKGSSPKPILHESCLQFIASYEHALDVLSHDLSGEHLAHWREQFHQQVKRFKAEVMRLNPRDDKSYKEMAERARDLKEQFYSVACNFYAWMEDANHPMLSASEQQSRLDKVHKPLEAAVNRYRAPRLCTDVMVVDVGVAKIDEALNEGTFDAASWQYYRRHTLRRATVSGAAHRRDERHPHPSARYEPTATAHDPDYCLANFAVVSQGTVTCAMKGSSAAGGEGADAEEAREFTAACSSMTSRFGSPSPAKAYSGNYFMGGCKVDRWQAIKLAHANMMEVLRNELALAVEAGVVFSSADAEGDSAVHHRSRLTHNHVHLLSDAGDSAQDEQIQHCAIAAYALRDVDVHTTKADGSKVSARSTFRYMDIGANWMRRSMSEQMTGMACMMVVDLCASFQQSFGWSPFAPEDLETYQRSTLLLQGRAREYIEYGGEHRLAEVKRHEKSVHTQAIRLSNCLKSSLQDPHNRKVILTAPAGMARQVGTVEWRHYYARQSLFVIMQLMPHINTRPSALDPLHSTATFRNRFRKNAFSNSCNCVLQALVPVLSDMLGEFGSSACKSNNDRAALVALRVSVFAQRMARGECITEGDLKKFAKELNEATAKEFEQSATHDHTEADCAGARSKGFPGDQDFYDARDYKATAKTGSTATHKAKSKFTVLPMPALFVCKPVVVAATVGVGELPAAKQEAARVLVVSELAEYSKKYQHDTTATRRFFSMGHHRRHQSIAKLISAVNTLEGEKANPCAARMLFYYVESVQTGAGAYGIAKRALQQFINTSFGGLDMASRNPHLLAAEESALVKEGVVWARPVEEGKPLVLRGKAEPMFKATNLNYSMQDCVSKLFEVIESCHAELSFQQVGLAKVFELIEVVNGAIASPMDEGLVNSTKLNATSLYKALERFDGLDDLPKQAKRAFYELKLSLTGCDLLELHSSTLVLPVGANPSGSA